MKKQLLSTITALVLLSLAVPPVLAQVEDPVTGSFAAANLTPTVTGIQVYSDVGLTTVADSLTPQVTYYVRVTAGDNNTVDDIDELEVRLFYDSAGSDPAAPAVANTQTCAIYLWDKDGGASEWTVSAGSPTSWDIVLVDSTAPAAMTASSGDWVFAVTVGKVATESPGGPDWDLYAEARDGGGAGTWYTRDKEVLWYGEISTTATAAFGTVTPGTGYADNTNEVGSISVTYISNGDYDQQVKSDATWTGATYNGTYDATGTCAAAQEFSLLAYDADTFGSAVQVDTTGVSIDATGTQTGETGSTVATNTLWLKVASVFAGDTYSGNITYIVADR